MISLRVSSKFDKSLEFLSVKIKSSKLPFDAYSVTITGLYRFLKSVKLNPINCKTYGWFNLEIMFNSLEISVNWSSNV